jgi:hypothetical protein
MHGRIGRELFVLFHVFRSTSRQNERTNGSDQLASVFSVFVRVHLVVQLCQEVVIATVYLTRMRQYATLLSHRRKGYSGRMSVATSDQLAFAFSVFVRVGLVVQLSSCPVVRFCQEVAIAILNANAAIRYSFESPTTGVQPLV